MGYRNLNSRHMGFKGLKAFKAHPRWRGSLGHTKLILMDLWIKKIHNSREFICAGDDYFQTFQFYGFLGYDTAEKVHIKMLKNRKLATGKIFLLQLFFELKKTQEFFSSLLFWSSRFHQPNNQFGLALRTQTSWNCLLYYRKLGELERKW